MPLTTEAESVHGFPRRAIHESTANAQASPVLCGPQCEDALHRVALLRLIPGPVHWVVPPAQVLMVEVVVNIQPVAGVANLGSEVGADIADCLPPALALDVAVPTTSTQVCSLNPVM